MLLSQFKSMEQKVEKLEDQQTWILNASAMILTFVVCGGVFSHWRLMREVEFAQRLLVDERKRSVWVLEKANRAECWYGIKPQSDPQCQ